MPNAIVFDMDGILFDTEKICFNAWQQVADKYGLGDVSDICRACVGVSREKSEEIFKSMVDADFPYAERRNEVSALCHKVIDQNGLPEKKGVRKILRFCKESGLKVGLATSTRRQTVLSHLERAGIKEYFDEIVCGDEITSSKPSPEIYLLACKKLGVQPKNAVAIEDSYNGIRSAHAAGMRCIMVPDTLPATDEMLSLCERIEKDLLKVVEYLKNDR